MDRMRANRGAWRRGPLPGVLTRSRLATLTAEAAWAHADEPRRGPDRLTSSANSADDAMDTNAMESEGQVRHGGCLCGAVRYEVHGAPQLIGLCHCADCRKATGGVALHYGDWPRAAFVVTGRLATHAGRSFCPSCGGRVVHLSLDTAEVNLGSLDEPPTDLVPMVEGWVIRREPWVAAVAGAAQFERDPIPMAQRPDIAAE